VCPRPAGAARAQARARAQAGIHIVTPNKKLNSGPLPQYQALRQFQRGSYIHFFYEARAA
jgi:homoserine dehydrogenase